MKLTFLSLIYFLFYSEHALRLMHRSHLVARVKHVNVTSWGSVVFTDSFLVTHNTLIYIKKYCKGIDIITILKYLYCLFECVIICLTF